MSALRSLQGATLITHYRELKRLDYAEYIAIESCLSGTILLASGGASANQLSPPVGTG